MVTWLSSAGHLIRGTPTVHRYNLIRPEWAWYLAPFDCTQLPLGTIDVFRRRMRDAIFWDDAWIAGAGARVVELKTGHDPMVSESLALSQILLDFPRDSQ